MSLTKAERRRYFSKLGRKGAKARIAKHGLDVFSQMGRRSAEKRRKTKAKLST